MASPLTDVLRRRRQIARSVGGPWTTMMDALFCALGVFLILLALSIIEPLQTARPALPDAVAICLPNDSGRLVSPIELVLPGAGEAVATSAEQLGESLAAARDRLPGRYIRLAVLIGDNATACAGALRRSVAPLLGGHAEDADRLALTVTWLPERSDGALARELRTMLQTPSAPTEEPEQ